MSELSVRIDELNNGDDKLKALILIERCKPSNYIMTHEIAKITKKHHYHVYVATYLTVKQVRNKFEYLFPNHKGSSYAIAKVKKPDTFRAYVLKDSEVIQTSYSPKEIKEMSTWIPKSEYKLSVLTKLKAHISAKELEEIASQMCDYYDNQNMAFDKYRMKAYAYAIYYHNNNKSRSVKKEISRYIIE